MFGLGKLISVLAKAGGAPSPASNRQARPSAGDPSNTPVAGDRRRVPPRATEVTLATNPCHEESILARAFSLQGDGRLREAHALLCTIAHSSAFSADQWTRVARIAFQAGHFPAAEAGFARALTMAPADYDARIGLAAALHAQDKLDAAKLAYREVLDIRSEDYDARIGLGNCLLEGNLLGEAEAQFRAAVALDPTRAVAWSFLARALDCRGRVAEAIVAHARAAELEGERDAEFGAGLALASSLRDDDRFDEALATFERYLEPASPAHMIVAYAHTLLAAGRLPAGWEYNEFRRFEPAGPQFGRPAWTGQDLRGKCILLRVEQGLGDAIQFLRYVPHVKALGATVLLLVSPALALLARGFAGVDHVIVDGVDRTAPNFDFQVALMSLPRLFGTDLATIPGGTPYLHVERERVERWADRAAAGGALAVGLAWGGNPRHLGDRHRSMSLATMAPLGAVRGVRFFSLQKGARAEEADSPPGGMQLDVLGPELDDLCDAAAAIMHLDLVICVDTALAHLAGALGKPVWLLIARPSDWRWLHGREDSPWYPTARLFRQRERDCWDDVIVRVAEALRERAEAHREGRTANAQIAPCVPTPSPRVESRPLSPECLNDTDAFASVTETNVGIVRLIPGDERARAIAWNGEWLQPQLDLVSRWLGAGMHVLQSGAAEGMHAIALSRIVGPEGSVLLFESRRDHRRILGQNLAVNGAANATVMPGVLSQAGADGLIDTLDALRLSRLDLLMVDDGEIGQDVLAASMPTLAKLRPVMLLRVRDDAELAAHARTAKAMGYRCWRQFTPFFRSDNFNRRRDDILSGRGALALFAVPDERASGTTIPMAQPFA